MVAQDWLHRIDAGQLDHLFATLYGAGSVPGERARYKRLIGGVGGDESLRLFSAPGRTELGGNHTDHNNGKVLAASVHLDSLAAVFASGNRTVELRSEGYPRPFVVDLATLEPKDAERGTTQALVRGVAAWFVAKGYPVGGFRGQITSAVLRGSGLSSSAAIEVLIGTCFSHLFAGGAVTPGELAAAGQFAENRYFGKPSGLEDQTASATGGIIAIDFLNPSAPSIGRVDFDFEERGLSLLVVDTGESHDNLTEDYAAIPAEMRAVAQAFGKSVCRELSSEEVVANVARLRRSVGDRAILRALHFFDDNARVERQIAALRAGDLATYLRAVRESGSSSWRLLQNCASTHGSSQSIPLALALTERFLGESGACRVHGGGFAGTIQAYVPTARFEEYRAAMAAVFGDTSVTRLRLRPRGSLAVDSFDHL